MVVVGGGSITVSDGVGVGGIAFGVGVGGIALHLVLVVLHLLVVVLGGCTDWC